MSMGIAHPAARIDAIRAALAVKPDGVLEAVARDCGAPLSAILEALPPGEAAFVDGARFEELWQDLATWGEVLLIVHTSDIVLECAGSLPVGSFGRGYYNIHGDSPIGGHIRAENCRAIWLVDRLFHGRRSCSVQFLNDAGEAMFKVFVRRDDERELLPEQLAAFEAMRERIAAL
ncbi:MAG: heme utilization cystosolic carrier protein HutX [Microvirga sp.]|nr:heme utilization cystosolic carrier protein HutX [Microvirga sp.]